MTKDEAKDGAIVCLVSGGPPMTVQNRRTDDEVCCYWFEGSALREDSFVLPALRLMPEEELRYRAGEAFRAQLAGGLRSPSHWESHQS